MGYRIVASAFCAIAVKDGKYIVYKINVIGVAITATNFC